MPARRIDLFVRSQFATKGFNGYQAWMSSNPSTKRGLLGMAVVVLLAALVACVLLWPGSQKPTSNPMQPAETSTAPVKVVTIAPRAHIARLREATEQVPLADAVRSGAVVARFFGNGRDTLRMQLRNTLDREIMVEISEGLLFQSEEAEVVTVRPRVVAVGPRREAEVIMACAGTHATNRLGSHIFSLSDQSVSELAVLLPYLQKHGEIPLPAIQTAVLALTENLPLSTFAKFTIVTGASAGTEERRIYQVHVRYIILALQMLKEIGYPMDRLTLVTDPQLKIEAMVDPLSHSAALRFFGIKSGQEFDFWKEHLLTGPPATRHYALFGIARNFPDTALRMMPKWAGQSSLDMAMRVAAVRALSNTRSEGAMPVLDQIGIEFSDEPTLIAAVKESKALLDDTLRHPDRYTLPIPFRITDPDILRIPDTLATEVAKDASHERLP